MRRTGEFAPPIANRVLIVAALLFHQGPAYATCENSATQGEAIRCLENRIKVLERRQAEDPKVPRKSVQLLSGAIVAWYPKNTSAIVSDQGKLTISVPEGWLICNGENGTPDLRDRFIFGTAEPVNIGAMGGKINHLHSGTTSNGINTNGPKKDHHHEGGVHHHTFTTESSEHLPPFVKLIYIMKK